MYETLTMEEIWRQNLKQILQQIPAVPGIFIFI